MRETSQLPAPGSGAFVFTAQEIRELDADLARRDLLELTMEHAGARVAEVIHARFPTGPVLALAGGGANGGDTFVAARHLHALGREVYVLAQGTRHELAGRMRRRLEGLCPIELLTEERLCAGLSKTRVVLDGLLGTGFVPPLREELTQWIRRINEAGKTVVSLDLPTGLPSDTAGDGSDAERVRADLTLALVGFKPGLLFSEVGEVQVLDLGVPPALLERHAHASCITPEEVRALLPRRVRGAHKGTAGRVYVLGGRPGYTGAPSLTAYGALRAGSGLVALYSRAELPRHPVESMAHRIEDWNALTALPRPDAVALGMGLGEDSVPVARRVLSWKVPVVLDADALQSELRGAGHDAVVWTPHPGEAARLLGIGTGDITRDPFAAARALQLAYGGTVVLKGGPSVIATPGALRVCLAGNPGMATGGSGDVLSGVIAALLGAGLSAPEAAIAGVYLHAAAGDRAYARLGYGLIASDIAHEVAPAWHVLHQASSEIL
ncbi:bifunctional ADP-dependent NAD(P)H-hydrate dehydratase/NAD(P)H-hydrate epimerase [Deinococcus peraridilitoris]|uniref:Bifunctional NAD(P)H-hydrate repair enzyme n=1 Tax=Deinococcus peraridilitoris (strain DSM 19664 / LMG 22246 / CIP 109416 / KR-200) TaxID=937777 RepID=L0A5R8_DEIPD|nr:bifunctional ADP-dependent NAD(P)H-hydrate dehydratase/NAD(P)H-hydrate epimerase [Deinococcus peraridilitoris]AFZ68365.1 yjeF-like protein, hydroxyethylthiazole kinase-related protein [Deinococcus peraridilitoris DSM 19664]